MAKPETYQPISRRNFLKLAAAAAVSLGLTVCGAKGTRGETPPLSPPGPTVTPRPTLAPDSTATKVKDPVFVPTVERNHYEPSIHLYLTPDQISAIEVFKNDQGELIKPPLHALTETEMANLEPMIAGLLAKKKITQPQADYLRGLYDLCFKQGGIQKISETMKRLTRLELPGPGISLRNKGEGDFVGPAFGFLSGYQPIDSKYSLITLQLEPGVLDPIKNPDKFWVAWIGRDPANVKMGPSDLVLVEANTGNLAVIEKLGETMGRGVDSWSIEELAGIFGAIPGAPVFVDRVNQAEKRAPTFIIILPQFPGANEGLGTRFSLKEF